MTRPFALPFIFLIGCTPSPDSADTSSLTAPVGTASLSGSEAATGSVNGEIKTPAEYLREPQFADADRARGELLSLACQACHTLGEGQAELLGPNLFGVFGRVSAGMEDYEYSPVLRAADIVWTPAALDAWLANPDEFLPGNDMAFAGYSAATDRRDLIAFLLHKTGGLGD